ncbi:MAG: Zn-ribbon domain-containing OB-fold protein [Janthinobacterium lividum]
MTMTTAVGYDVSAIVSADTAPFHRFLRGGTVRMQRCSQCGYIRYPSRPYCPECLSDAAEWATLPGTGKVEAFVWYLNDAYDPEYDAAWAWREVPYNVALITLDGGPTLLSNVVNVDAGGLQPGQPVQPVFVPISPEHAILRFEIAGAALPLESSHA